MRCLLGFVGLVAWLMKLWYYFFNALAGVVLFICFAVLFVTWNTVVVCCLFNYMFGFACDFELWLPLCVCVCVNCLLYCLGLGFAL